MDVVTKDEAILLVANIKNSLLAVCDGAVTEDAQGFNKPDTIVARYVSVDQQPLRIARMLIKYKGQIIGMGYNFENLLKSITILEKALADGVVGKISVEITDKEVVVKVPYNKQVIGDFRKLNGWWHNDAQMWTFLLCDVKVVLETVRKYFPDAELPEYEEKPFGTIKVENGRTIVKTSYNPKFVNVVKNFKSSRWNNNDKTWTIDLLSATTIEKIHKMATDFKLVFEHGSRKELDETLAEFKRMEAMKEELMTQSNATEAEIDIPGLNGILYGFQGAGVEFLENVGGRALIADEMGLGKTIQALAWLQLHPKARPAIIVCPASLKTNWKRETEKWLSDNKVITVIQGIKNGIEKADIMILNYDIVKNHLEKLVEINPKVVILDECHYIKNHKAQRTEAVLELCRDVPYLMALSGTPMLNRPIELWTTLNAINPREFNNFWDFAQRYCDPQSVQGYGWDLTGASHLDELQVKLRQNVMIRRLKKDVLHMLPQKRRMTIALEPNVKIYEEYKKAESSLRSWLYDVCDGDTEKMNRALRAEFLVKINALRQIIARAKMDSAKEWIGNMLESQTEKIVAFCCHHTTVNAIKEKFEDVLTITGKDSLKERQESIDEFQNNPDKKMIVCTFGAGGVGITLTAAHDVVMLELPWRPADLQQAEDRLHRIGQEEQVNAWYLLCADTIDEEMLATINEKMKISAQALDPEADVSIQDNLIRFVLEKEERTE